MSVFRRSGAHFRPLPVLGLMVLGLLWTAGMPSPSAQAGPEQQGLLPSSASADQDAQPGADSSAAGAQSIDALDAIGSVFMYQGRLSRLDRAVDGTCDFRFRLFDADTDGNAVGPANSDSLMVRDGRFNAVLDFGGGAFIGNPRWLAVELRCPGDSEYIALEPRQFVAPAPYAQYADRAHWGGLVAVPEGFADGVDNGTEYSAGTGMALVGSTFVVSTTYRLPQGCSDGQVTKLSGTQNRWICADESGVDNAWQVGGNAGLSSGQDFLGTTDAQPLRVRTNDSETMHLSATGDLGLGLDGAAPSERVHVLGSRDTMRMLVHNESTTGRTELQARSDDGVVASSGVLGSAFLGAPGMAYFLGGGANLKRVAVGSQSAAPLEFWTANQNRMTLTAGGALGIGTDAPAAQLHLQGAVAEDSGDVEMRIENTDATGITELSLLNDAGTTLLMGLTGSGRVDGDTVGITASGTSTTSMKISNTSGDLSLRGQVVDIKTAGGAMRLAENGKVGINTEAPTELLEVVDGNIKVTNGDIIDAFLMSDAPPSSLASGRPALELAALREHLASGGSLPRLPSFEEMARDGHSLAAYDLALRAQIEDLLLYLLEQEAMVEALEAQRSSQAALLAKQTDLLEAQANRLEQLGREWTRMDARMQALEQSWAEASTKSAVSSSTAERSTSGGAKSANLRRSGAGAPAR